MPSDEVVAMTHTIAAWAHGRWGDVRVLRELVMGSRRIDLVVVAPTDIVGIEIKSSVDTLARLRGQVAEFRRYVPELWIAAAPKWRDHLDRTYDLHANRAIVTTDQVETVGNIRIRPGQPGRKPVRDELSIMRLLELLWRSEVVRIAERTGTFPGASHSQVKSATIKAALARLLTGNEILREVCAELRARPLVGQGSDAPVRTVSA